MEVSSWENHLFLWAIYTMAMLDNQSVRGEVLKEGQGPRTISLRCLNNPSSIGLTILNYHVLWKLLCPNRLIILPMSVDYNQVCFVFHKCLHMILECVAGHFLIVLDQIPFSTMIFSPCEKTLDQKNLVSPFARCTQNRCSMIFSGNTWLGKSHSEKGGCSMLAMVDETGGYTLWLFNIAMV